MPSIRLAPVTAALVAAFGWGGAFWLLWPSERFRPALIAAGLAFTLVYLVKHSRTL